MTLSPSFNDLDRDGCSDRVELQLTKSNLQKFNGLGIGDCDLNYVWGTSQDSMETVLQSGQDFISLNLSEDPTQNIFPSPQHLIFMGGVFSSAPTNDKVKVEFAITNSVSGLSYNLGSESPEFAKLVGSDGFQALFSYLNKFNFPNGTYTLTASANLSRNNSVSTTRTFTIDSSVAQTDLNVIDFSGFKFNLFEPNSSLSDVKFDVDSNGNAYVYGQTNFNNKVVAAWNSVLLTSVVMADSSSGKFFVEPRQKLPAGQHKVILFAENLDNPNVKSLPVEITFTVKSNFEKAFIIIRNISILIAISGFGYALITRVRGRKMLKAKTVA
jgi:hypothetical protein